MEHIPQELSLKLNYIANQMRTEIHNYGKKMYTEEAYKKGAEDAWKYAKKVCCDIPDGGLCISDLIDIFGDFAAGEIMKLPFEEVKEKIDAFETKGLKHEIIPGDIVELTVDDHWDQDADKGTKAIVEMANIEVANKPERDYLIRFNGNKRLYVPKSHIRYIGKHYPTQDEINKRLKELNNDTDN